MIYGMVWNLATLMWYYRLLRCAMLCNAMLCYGGMVSYYDVILYDTEWYGMIWNRATLV